MSIPRRALGFLLVAAILPACGVSGKGGATLTPTVAPQVPLNLVAKAGNHRVTLSWTGSAPATSYTVKRSSISGGPYAALPLGTVNSSSFIDTALVNHVTYYYVVNASNAFGSSPDSAEISAAGAFKATQVSTGSNSVSALLQDGTVWSWGLNGEGELGNGLNCDSIVPVQVVGLPLITQIWAGGRSGYALDHDGRIWSWGQNNFGQLGQGTSVLAVFLAGLLDTSTGLPRCRGVSAGWRHGLAWGDDGTLWCWGDSADFRLGSNGGTTNQPRPVTIPVGLSVVTAINTGDHHNLVLSQDGTVWCWGRNDGGQLGTLDYLQPLSMVQVLHLTGVVAVAGGASHSLALRNDGTVWAWGSNIRGQLGNGVGDGNTENKPLPAVPLDPAPVLVNGASGATPLTGIIAIEAHASTSLALRIDGTVWSWGSNPGLGNPTVAADLYSPYAVQVSGLNNQVAIATGGFSFSVGADGTVWAWGANDQSECAYGTAFRQNVAIQLPSLNKVTAIAAGGSPDPFQSIPGGALVPGEGHALSISTAGQAWSWGNNNDKQLGLGPLGPPVETAAPGLVLMTGSVALANVSAVAAGGTHSIVVNTAGVWCAGANGAGQLGNGNNTASDLCVQTIKVGGAFLTGVSAVAAGEAHSVALLNNGDVWAWGDNSSGQLGIGSVAPSNVAVQVKTGAGAGAFLQNIVAVSAGFGHCVALKNDNTVWAWGDNTWGQVGNGSVGGNSPYAVQVQQASPAGPLTGIAEIAAGRFHNLARTSTGTVVAWGDNSMAQLGKDPTITKIYPRPFFLQQSLPNHPYHPTTAPPLIEPAAVPVLDGSGTPIGAVVGLSAGAYHSVALRNDLNDATKLSVWGWGDDSTGALGNADAILQSPALTGADLQPAFPPVPPAPPGSKWTTLITPFSPVPVPMQYTVPTGLGVLRGLTSISAGAHFTLARSADGTVWGSGSNAQSQLGSTTVFTVIVPVPIDP